MVKERTWHDNWNDVIRHVLFQDTKLKALMLIPSRDIGNIRAFVDRYFVADEMGAEVLTNEPVRVLHYVSEGKSFGDHVRQKYLHFDIYVKREEVYTVDDDRLRRRDQQIAQRIKELLTDTTYVGNMRYRYEDDFDLGTKTVGYRRYHIVFSYKTTY